MVFMRNTDRQMKSNLDFWILCCNYVVSVKSVLGLFVIFLILQFGKRNSPRREYLSARSFHSPRKDEKTK